MCPPGYENVLQVPTQGTILEESVTQRSQHPPPWVPQALKIQMQHFTCCYLKFNEEKKKEKEPRWYARRFWKLSQDKRSCVLCLYFLHVLYPPILERERKYATLWKAMFLIKAWLLFCKNQCNHFISLGVIFKARGRNKLTGPHKILGKCEGFFVCALFNSVGARWVKKQITKI